MCIHVSTLVNRHARLDMDAINVEVYDKRLGIMTEIIDGIKAIKLCGMLTLPERVGRVCMQRRTLGVLGMCETVSILNCFMRVGDLAPFQWWNHTQSDSMGEQVPKAYHGCSKG